MTSQLRISHFPLTLLHKLIAIPNSFDPHFSNEDTQKLPTQLKEPPVLGSAAKDERNADEEIKMDDNDDDFVMGELDDV